MDDRLNGSLFVKPVHTIEGRSPHQIHDCLSRAFLAHQRRLVKPVDSLGRFVVVTVPSAVHPGLDSRLQEPLALAEGGGLEAAITLVYQPVFVGLACIERSLLGI